MKKVTDFLRPNILIIFGALLFLFFLNYLSASPKDEPATLAIGIIATILSVYYLAIGILGLFLGDKLPKKVFEVVSVCLFAVFMFTYFLIALINGAQVKNYMGPTAWIIAILSLIGSLALAAIYPVARFVKNKVVLSLAYLFSAIFALVLLLNILFNPRGNSTVLGNIDLILVAIYGVFLFYLFGTLGQPEEAPAPKKVEAKEEPKEEQPAQEEEAQ